MISVYKLNSHKRVNYEIVCLFICSSYIIYRYDRRSLHEYSNGSTNIS